MKIALTGHSGFKGVWFACLMRQLGNEVHGFSLPPSLEPHAVPGPECKRFFESEEHGSVLDHSALQKWLWETNPEVAVHFAAQPLVMVAEENRIQTFQTNVEGTLNFLKAVEMTPSTRFALVITTDKVYVPRRGHRHVETDQLGGDEPYSQSKAVADYLTQEWAKSSSKAWGIARAGNIIGFGDWSPGRLLPDIARSFETKEPLSIRNPSHIRPWQHVLECVSAYQHILEFIAGSRQPASCEIFNVGPDDSSTHSVGDVVIQASKVIQFETINNPSNKTFLETPELQLSSEKAMQLLDWRPKLSFEESISWTLSPLESHENVADVIQNQVEHYLQI